MKRQLPSVNFQSAAIPPAANAFSAVDALIKIIPELVVTTHDDIAAAPAAAPEKLKLRPMELSAHDKGTNKIGIKISFSV